MKRNNGFTLIELLAVIVILAVIALIAVPIILNMIGNARKSAAKSSALGYIDAIEYNNGLSEINNEYGLNYTKITGKNIKVTDINIKMKGKKPTGGTVSIDDSGKVSKALLCIEGYSVSYINKKANVGLKCSSNGEPTGAEYTLSFNSNGGSHVDSITAKEGSSITLPVSSKENSIFLGWFTELEGGEKITSEAMPDDDTTYYAHWVVPGSFSTDSWETINLATKNNILSSYQLGDKKTITMDVNGDNTDETYHIMIVNKTNCTDETSESACGLVLQFEELLNITVEADKKMNSTQTSAGGWPAMSLRTYLNTTIYNKLPSDLKNIIKDTSVISGRGQFNNAPNTYTSSDKLYFPQTKEVGFDVTYDTARTYTRKLDYYDAGTSSSANAKRVKYKYGTSTAENWWLGSPSSGSGYRYYVILADGTTGGTNDGVIDPAGVAPAFRVGV